MRIRFLQDAVYETEGFRKGPRFEAGSTHELREDLAQRWINRGIAERVEVGARPRREPPAPPAAPPTPPAPTPADPPAPAADPPVPPAASGPVLPAASRPT